MRGTMMDFPLTLNTLLERAKTQFAHSEIVSRLPTDSGAPERTDLNLHRYSYADFYKRARALAEALQRAGVKPGDRVATLMWNTYQHLECYFGIPAAGAVTHTLNLRLHPDELAYIVDHAQDRVLIVQECLLPVWEQVRERLTTHGRARGNPIEHI